MELHLTLNEPGSHRRISSSRGPVRRSTERFTADHSPVRWSHRSIASVYWRRRPFDSAAAIHRAAWRGEADDGGFVINWTTGDGSKGWDSVGVIAIIAPAEHEGRSVLEFSVENFPNNSPSPAPVEGFGLDREQLRFSISSTDHIPATRRQCSCHREFGDRTRGLAS